MLDGVALSAWNTHFLSIDDKPLIVYTMEKFQQHPVIDEIAVVCLEGWEGMLKAYAKQFGISKLRWVFKGGETGMQSIQNAVFGLKEVVLCQDLRQLKYLFF